MAKQIRFWYKFNRPEIVILWSNYVRESKGSHFIDIRMINLIDEADGRRFVGISIRQFYSNPPNTTLVKT